MESSSSSSKVVPESAMEAVERTLANLKQMETHLLEFLSLVNPDVLDEMPPLQRAQSLFMFAKATSTLFALRLRTSGIHPEKHPIKTELAATRFIEHSLPGLTPEQRKSLRNISKGEGPKIKHTERSARKKRKCDTSEKQSLQTAAQEFLEKAARELFGGNTDGFKGPLIKIDSSSEE